MHDERKTQSPRGLAPYGKRVLHDAGRAHANIGRPRGNTGMSLAVALNKVGLYLFKLFDKLLDARVAPEVFVGKRRVNVEVQPEKRIVMPCRHISPSHNMNRCADGSSARINRLIVRFACKYRIQ